MFKRFKSIAAAIMAVVMLMSICCVPAMAAEKETTQLNTYLTQDVEITPFASSNSFELNGAYMTDTPKTLLGGINITSGRYTIKHKLTGKILSGTIGKTVIFQLRNTSTGATRSFTAVSNQGWLQDTYNTAIAAGYYELWVIYTEKSGEYGIEIEIV